MQGMDVHAILSLVASVAHLALALLVLVNRARSPLAIPIAVLSLDMFGWNAADVGSEVTGNATWTTISDVLSPLTTPLGLHVVLVFLGQYRARRAALVGWYAIFVVLALFPVLGISRLEWSYALAAGVVMTALVAVGLLAHHAWNVADRAERSRTLVILAAFAVAAMLAIPELIDPESSIRLSNIGTLGATVLVSLVAMRWRLLGREVSARAALYALGLSGVALFGALTLFRSIGVGVSRALAVAGSLALSLAVLAATRTVVAARTEDRERLKHLATLGRFSSQMAHDLRNPLATIKGALQFLSEERTRGNSLDPQGDFINVMLAEVDRMQSTVAEYERIGRVEPRRVVLNINDVIRSILTLQRFATSPNIDIHADLADDLPSCEADRELVANSIENVVKNAVEAISHQGRIVVRTARAGSDRIVIVVEDTGGGMDARQMTRAFDEFFTTKVGGSGLGLSFVRRVLRAHGGEISLEHRAGGGTVVRMHLPVETT